MDLHALRERLRALVDEMRGIDTPPDGAADDWAPDADALARFETLDTEAETLRTQIADAERRLERVNAAAEAARVQGDDNSADRGRFGVPNVNRGDDPWDTDTLRFDETAANLRARIATGLERDDVTPNQFKEAALATLRRMRGRPSDRLAVTRSMVANGAPAYRSAFAKMMQGQHWALTETERQAVERAQSLTNTAGGFAVPFTLDPSVIMTNDSAINPIRRIARTVSTATQSWNGVTGGAAAASWDAEEAEVSDDSITLAQPAIPVHKMNLFIPFSVEIEGDWADIDSDLRAAMIEGRDVLEATAHIKGTGTGQPTGIETALDGTASEVAPETAETFAPADVYGLQRVLPPRHRMAMPRWVFNIGTANDIRQFDTAGGGNFWASLAPGAPETLLGWGWDEASAVDDSPDINPAASEDNFVIFVGNWDRYVVVDRVGMSIELVPHLFGANQRPTGQRGYYGYMRTGADSVDDNAFRALSIPTTA